MAVPSHCSGVTVSDRMMLADRMAIGNSIDVNIFAIPPDTNGAPNAKKSGGRTAPNNDTPAAVVNKLFSKGRIVGRSRIKTTSTMMVDPVTIKELRVHASTFTATFPLKKIKPA